MARVGPDAMGDDERESKRVWGLVREITPFCLFSCSRIRWEISGDLDGNPIVSCFLACGILFGCLSLYFNLKWLLPSPPISTTISSLPRLSVPHNSSCSESMAVVAPAAPDSQPQFHVLAVDDSLIDRKLIERLLKTSSYQVTAVDSGRKALELLGLQDEQMDPPALSHTQDIEVHLIITDYWMPGMTGYDLLKKIKNSSSLKDIPVVIMSSENVPSRINRCLQEGAEEFFLKPVQLSDVKKLQPHLLKGKPREQPQPQQKQLLLPPLQQQQPPQPLLMQQQPQPEQLLQEFCNKRKAIDECMLMTNTRQRCEGKEEVLCNVSDTPSLVKRVFTFH